MPRKNVGTASKKRLQKEKQKESNLGRNIAMLLILMVIVGLSIGILFSSAFNLTEVVIENGVNVTAAEISSLIEVTYGENVLKQNYKNIKEKTLSLPYIADANVMIHFPDKIKITYTERKPYAAIKFLETFFIVDTHGYLLEANKEMSGDDLTIIYGLDLAGYELGSQLTDVPGLKFKNIVQLLETVKQKGMHFTVSEIDYDSVSDVKFWIDEAEIEIIYGEIEKEILIDKLNHLEEVIKNLIAEKKAGRVDVSSDSYYENTLFTDINNL